MLRVIDSRIGRAHTEHTAVEPPQSPRPAGAMSSDSIGQAVELEARLRGLAPKVPGVLHTQLAACHYTKTVISMPRHCAALFCVRTGRRLGARVGGRRSFIHFW